MNKLNLKQTITAIIFFCCINQMSSQIVSLDERRTADPSKGIQGDMQLTLNYTENEKKVLQSGTKLNLQLNDNLNTYMFYTDITLSRTDGVNDLSSGDFGLIYNYKAKDRVISAEALMQYQYNGGTSLNYRYIIGGGPRWKMVEKDDLQLSIVAYTIYLNELYETTVSNKNSMAKFSTMLSFYTKVSESVSIKHNTYYEPNYSNPSDYRIESETTFKAKINNKFSYKLYVELNYISNISSEIDNFNYSLKNSFSFSF